MKQRTLREDAHSREAKHVASDRARCPNDAKAHSCAGIAGNRPHKNRKRGNPDMERNMFTYEAIDSALVIHTAEGGRSP